MKIDCVNTHPVFTNSGRHYVNYGSYKPVSNRKKALVGGLAIGLVGFYFRKPLKNYGFQLGRYIKNALENLCK